MPLFKKNHDEASGMNNAGFNGNNNFDGQRYDGRQTNLAGGPGAGVGSQQLNDPLYSSNAPAGNQNMMRGTGAGVGASQWDDSNNVGYSGQPGMGASTGATAPGATQAAVHPMRPQTDAAGNPINPAHSAGGSGKRMEGKVERVVGTMIGSQSLKAKGLAKEQEASALKAQAAELTEAERLEQAALARRERAVAHGAHPDHRHLGGHNPGVGATHGNEFVGGANYTDANGMDNAGRRGY